MQPRVGLCRRSHFVGGTETTHTGPLVGGELDQLAPALLRLFLEMLGEDAAGGGIKALAASKGLLLGCMCSAQRATHLRLHLLG